jgi:hypothetical protein
MCQSISLRSCPCSVFAIHSGESAGTGIALATTVAQQNELEVLNNILYLSSRNQVLYVPGTQAITSQKREANTMVVERMLPAGCSAEETQHHSAPSEHDWIRNAAQESYYHIDIVLLFLDTPKYTPRRSGCALWRQDNISFAIDANWLAEILRHSINCQRRIS